MDTKAIKHVQVVLFAATCMRPHPHLWKGRGEIIMKSAIF